MQSPQTFSRGKVARSRSTVFSPPAAQSAAHVAPPGPPPTTATSYWFKARGGLHERRADGVGHHLTARREHRALLPLREKTEIAKLRDGAGPPL